MLVQNAALWVAGFLGGRPRKRTRGCGYRILLTGRFESDNWVLAHLRPLSASERCSRLQVVTTYRLPAIHKVEAIYPPRWLVMAVGQTFARLAVFAWVAVRTRPDIVGGFHLLINGLVTVVVARLVRARSLYFCVGGPGEMIDGGVWQENKFFAKMLTPDPVVERRLLRAVAACDLIVTMGSRAKQFFRHNGVESDIHVISGGIDAKQFVPGNGTRSIDLIIVGRVVEIKRIDVCVNAIRHVVDRMGSISAVVVGDGPLRAYLERLSADLGVSGCVSFVGHQENVPEWLNRSKVFVLTSDSEGLSLALMEAMMCGLPAIVSNVGELGELVQDGINGFLVERRQPGQFADRLVMLLTDEQRLSAFSCAARRSAMRYETSSAVREWDRILA